MWTPDTVQISKDLIEQEVKGTIPAGSSVATAVFMMNSATKETAKTLVETFRLDRDAATVAWKFLQTGKIVTADGEILTETSVAASPSKVVAPNPPTAPSVSSTNADVVEAVRVVFKRYFPNWVEPTAEQCMDIMNKVRDIEFVDNALYNMANGKQEIKNPITLLLWLTKNRTFEQVQQEREILEKQGLSGDSIIRKAARAAEAMIPDLPPPTTTQDDVDLLKALREKVERGRSQPAT